MKKRIVVIMILLMICSSLFAEGSKEKPEGLFVRQSNEKTIVLADGSVYPTRQIELVVPQKAGGGTDVFCRQLASQMSEIIGQPIIVTNITGASGLKGIGQVMNSAADGYTLVASNPPGEQIAYLTQNPDFKMEDLTSIAGYSKDIICLIASASCPYNTLPELIDAYKNGKISSIGAPGKGDAGYISLNRVKDQAGLEFTNLITYGGSADVVSAILRKEIEVGIAPSNAFVTAVADGNVKVICALSDQRFPTLPEVPSYGEYGYPSIEATTILSRCIFAPAGLPDEIKFYLQDVIKEVVSDQKFIDFAASRKLPAIFSDSNATKAILNDSLALGPVINLSK